MVSSKLQVNQKYKEISATTLANYFTKCEYPLFNETLQELKKLDIAPQKQVADFKICGAADMCFPRKNDALQKIQEELATKEKNDHKNQNIQQDNQLLYDQWKNFCLRQEIIATKVIRLYELDILDPLKNLDSQFLDNFRIIYLIRDPRAMYNSRMKTVGGWTNPRQWRKTNIDIQCDPAMKSLKYLDSERGAWLRDKVLFIRYEDLAVEPEIYVQKIYNFTGCTTDQGLNNNCGYNTIAEKFLDLTHTDQTLDQIKNMSSTKKKHSTGNRNSSEVAYKWLKEINYADVKEIQDHCDPEFWNIFGYKKYSTQEEMEADQNKDDLIDEKSLISQWRFA